MATRINANDGPYNTQVDAARMQSVSDMLDRIRFLDQSPRQQQEARERLARAAWRNPRSSAARLERLGVYGPGDAAELRRLRERLGGLV